MIKRGNRRFRTLRRHFLDRRHTTLLAVIITALAVRPLIGDFGAGPLIYSLSLLGLLLVALLTIQVDDLVGEREVLLRQRKRRIRVAWALAVPAFAERLYVLFAPTPRLYMISAVSWLLFFAFVTWTQLRTLLKHKAITCETISMSISIYLLLGLTWGVLYVVIFQSDPQAFAIGAASNSDSPSPEHQLRIIPILTYFSLTTLSTIGFGDITPLTLQARYAAVAEGITGQFYMAILVARLVGMQMHQRISPPANPIQRDR